MHVCVCESVSYALAFFLGGSLIRGTPPDGVKGILVVTFFPMVSIYVKHTTLIQILIQGYIRNVQ